MSVKEVLHGRNVVVAAKVVVQYCYIVVQSLGSSGNRQPPKM